jgi:hypothetical protein
MKPSQRHTSQILPIGNTNTAPSQIVEVITLILLKCPNQSSLILICTGCGRNTSQFLKVNICYSKFYFTIWKNNVYHFQNVIWQSGVTMFTSFSPLFKNYVAQMPTFIFYTYLKSHSEVPHYSSGHFRWYCRDFVLDSSFQFVCCPRPTFVDFNLQMPPEKEVTSGEVGWTCWPRDVPS